jgi:hypothetical protein
MWRRKEVHEESDCAQSDGRPTVKMNVALAQGNSTAIPFLFDSLSFSYV